MSLLHSGPESSVPSLGAGELAVAQVSAAAANAMGSPVPTAVAEQKSGPVGASSKSRLRDIRKAERQDIGSAAMVSALEGRMQNFPRLNRELLEMFERLAAKGDDRFVQLLKGLAKIGHS